jgi:acetyl-CoA synthetase
LYIAILDLTMQADYYPELYRDFHWQVPEFFNMADVCCRRWAQLSDAMHKIAVRAHETGATSPNDCEKFSYAQLFSQANQLSHVLVRWGVQRGDRVAIVMPQRFETAVAYMAVLQLGAVAMPLSILFGPEALEYRLQDSDAVVAICDDSSVGNLLAVRKKCASLRTLVGVGDAADRTEVDYAFECALMPKQFDAARTKADDAAVLIYTSGTTGPPKGALIPHRALIGNLSGFVASQNWFGFDAKHSAALTTQNSHAVFWSPADWAWTGGLMDALLPTLYFGCEIVAYNGRFSPELALNILQTHKVTHTFLFPTALKAMMKAYPHPRQQFDLHLQACMSAGEAVGDAVFAYCRDELGVTVNEMFGQTEINYVVGNCSMAMGQGPAPSGGSAAHAVASVGVRAAAQGPAPSGGSAAHALASVGVRAAAQGRPKQGPAPSGGSAAHAVASVGVSWPAKPGSMGRAYPGHRVAVIDDAGQECAIGTVGDVAVNRYDIHGHADPVFFLGYWKNAAATAKKYTGNWCRTGDLATQDADGYLWYQGRSDDVFKAAGYRIGPSEVENCLVKHPAVVNAAVVPKPDVQRGAVVKAYVVLTPDLIAARAGLISQNNQKALKIYDQNLVQSIQNYVKGQLAPYEYPKDIEFLDALPMTTTGKVQRNVLRLQEQQRAMLA